MNGSQVSLLAVASANLALMLLFPPYDSVALGRGSASFDAFYFVFDAHFNKAINANLLLLQIYWVLINAALGLYLLRTRPAAPALLSRRAGVVVLVAVNLALILLLPPFENYSSSYRFTGTYFDGFYFLFGDKWQRRIYLPLLYLELLWVLIDGAVLWLLFREPRPSGRRPAPA